MTIVKTKRERKDSRFQANRENRARGVVSQVGEGQQMGAASGLKTGTFGKRGPLCGKMR